MAKVTKRVKILDFNEENGHWIVQAGTGPNARNYNVPAEYDPETGDLLEGLTEIRDSIGRQVMQQEAQRERAKAKAESVRSVIGHEFDVEVDTVPERMVTRITMERTSI